MAKNNYCTFLRYIISTFEPLEIFAPKMISEKSEELRKGEVFRRMVRKGRKIAKVREVAAFTPASLQDNVVIKPLPPPQPRFVVTKPVSNFRRYIIAGLLPVRMHYGTCGNKIMWKIDFKRLDYKYILPVFLEGLCDVEYPFSLYAQQGVQDLLLNGRGKILPLIPRTIHPIKKVLYTRNKEAVTAALKAIQQLVRSDFYVGVALVPYFKSLLPVVNTYKTCKTKSGDSVDYSQRGNEDIVQMVNETLEILEKYGGPYAYINIKYAVPTYESILFN